MKRTILLVGLGAVLAGLALWVIVSAVTGEISAVAISSLVVAALAFVGDLIALTREFGLRTDASVRALADQLADVLREEWYAEAKARRLRDRHILSLSWDQSQPGLGDSPQAVMGRSNVKRITLAGRLEGDFDQAVLQLTQAYRRIESGRLVVLGEPGSGKSALALMLGYGLLEERDVGDAIPVVLLASSWDPLSESLHQWVVRSLADAYYSGRTEVPERLWRQDLLLPVVDGLDEIHESSRRSAVRALNDALGTAGKVVVTCRSVEYQDLIEGGAPVLSRAPVVEVNPVGSTDLMMYLRSLDWPADVNWLPVAAYLETHPEAPLAQALSTPLMASLVRTVYQRLGGDPAELLSGFDSRHAVEDHLVDRVIDAAYAPDPMAGPSSPETTDPEEARRRLTFIAQYLHRHGDRDFDWWRMGQRLLSPWIAVTLGICGGALLTIAVAAWIALLGGEQVTLKAAIIFGSAVGIGFAVLMIIIWFSTADRAPGRLAMSAAGSANRLRRGFLAGIGVVAIPVVPILGLVAVTITLTDAWSLANVEPYLESVFGAAAVAIVLGSGLAVHSWLDAPPRQAAEASPYGFLRQDRRSSLLGATAAGATVGLLVLPGVATGMTLGSLVAKLLSGGAGYPGGINLGILVRARFADATSRPFATALLALGATVVLPAVAVAMLVLLTRAWPRFIVVRLVPQVRRNLPWDILGFLADARDRELIRQSAGTYQFRHVRLQERLANRARVPTTSVVTDVRGAWWLDPRWRAAATATVVAVGLLAAIRIPDDSSTAVLAGAHGSGPYSPWASQDGSVVATTADGDDTIRVWDVPNWNLISSIQIGEIGPKGETISDVKFTQDSGALLVDTTDSGNESHTYIVDIGRRRVVRRAEGTGVLTPGERVLLTLGPQSNPAQESVELWDTHNWTLITHLPGELVDQSSGPDGSSIPMPQLTVPTFTVVMGRDLSIRRSDDASIVRRVALPQSQLPAELSPDGQSVIVDGVGAWSARDGHSLDGPREYNSISASPKGVDRWMATSGGRQGIPQDDNMITLWAASRGEKIKSISQPVGASPLFYAGGRRLVTSSVGRGPIRFLGLDSQAGTAVLDVHGLAAYEVASSMNDAILIGRLATDRGAKLRLWSLISGHELSRPVEGTLPPSSDSSPADATLSPDGRTLIWTDAIGRAQLLRLDTFDPSVDLGADLQFTSSGFSSNSGVFVAGYSDHIELWGVAPDVVRGETVGFGTAYTDSTDSLESAYTDSTNSSESVVRFLVVVRDSSAQGEFWDLAHLSRRPERLWDTAAQLSQSTLSALA